ncbi:MAG: pro-sigmaK processing inhibitor BofA family protein, partial [Firmicutes bacterium]|nr:pro-sigmaK processing inhibitor BofA family protein [Bacillota bacterium]
LNAVGSTVGLMIPLNLVNAVTVGILGVPGVIMLLLFCN